MIDFFIHFFHALCRCKRDAVSYIIISKMHRRDNINTPVSFSFPSTKKKNDKKKIEYSNVHVHGRWVIAKWHYKMHRQWNQLKLNAFWVKTSKGIKMQVRSSNLFIIWTTTYIWQTKNDTMGGQSKICDESKYRCRILHVTSTRRSTQCASPNIYSFHFNCQI